MEEGIKAIFGASVSKILIVAGLGLIYIAAMGGFGNKFQAGTGGRVLAGVSAPIVLFMGLALQFYEMQPAAQPSRPLNDPPALVTLPTAAPPVPTQTAQQVTVPLPQPTAVPAFVAQQQPARWTADQVQVFMNSCVFQYLNPQPWCVCFLGKVQTRYTFQEVDAIIRFGLLTNQYPQEYLRFIQECNLGR